MEGVCMTGIDGKGWYFKECTMRGITLARGSSRIFSMSGDTAEAGIAKVIAKSSKDIE